MVKALVSYLGPFTGKPAAYGHQRHLDNLPLEDREIEVRDLRSSEQAPTLDREGFMLLDAPTRIKDFFSPDATHSDYLCESAEIVKKASGATKVVPSIGCVVRRSERSANFREGKTTVLGRFVHCDFSPNPEGSRLWVRKVLPSEEAEKLLQRRFAIYNLWRVLSPPPQDTPLALCDAQSVAPRDAIPADCVVDTPDEPEFRFENLVYRYNPGHHWGYFSNMLRSEALIFKGYDSDASATGGVPHVAFTDPTCGQHAPARESIDARFLAFFD